MGDDNKASNGVSHSKEDADSFTGEEQNLLFYDKAIKLKASGQSDEALKFFTRCLEGVDATCPFTKLPQCLQEIAAIYYDKEDYEKAVQFAQAEKLYYEAALIDSASATSSVQNNSTTTNDQYVQKANEYEQLASLCLKQHKIDLALEYCGKVAKIRQSALGPSNPATVRSLDMFTVLYAEAGRQQYADALKVARDFTTDDDELIACTEQPSDQGDCDASVETKVAEAQAVMTADTVDSKIVQNSSINCGGKAILFYLLITSTFAVMLSFWVVW